MTTDFTIIERETIRRLFLHLPSNQLEVIQEVANAILDDRDMTIASPEAFKKLFTSWREGAFKIPPGDE